MVSQMYDAEPIDSCKLHLFDVRIVLALDPNAMLTKEVFLLWWEKEEWFVVRRLINATALLQNFLSVKTSRKYLVSEGGSKSVRLGSSPRILMVSKIFRYL
ncbi:hypothetical protein TNCV_5065951 [Trichonephila clavipes]|nr:hypothetical protein TNCV_5065951 [Trichonephila clavipes]